MSSLQDGWLKGMNKIIKQTCLVVGSIVILCLLIFHQTLLTHIAKWSVQAYSVAKWGKPLQYESLFLQDYKLVVIKPRFDRESFFSAERLALDFRFELLKRQIQIDVDLDEPHWHIPSIGESSWEHWAKLLNQEDKWVKTHPYLHFKKGTLSWAIDDAIHQLTFDLKANNHEGGTLKLYFDTPDSDRSYLVLKSSRLKQGAELDCYCHNVDCSSLVALGQMAGVDFSPWHIASGTINGEVKAVFSGGCRPFLEGDLLFSHLHFRRIGTALKGKIEEATLHLERNKHPPGQNCAHMTTVGRIDLLKETSLSYHSSEHAWDIYQIKGSVALNDAETALIDLQAKGGDFHHPSKWRLAGEANLNPEHSPKLSLVLSSLSQKSNEGSIRLAFNQLKGGHRNVEIDCKKLLSSDCTFLQTLLATQWPLFQQVTLEDGTFDGLFEASFTSQGLGELHVKRFEASHVASKIKSWNIACRFADIKGEGKIDLSRRDFWSSLQAGLHIENGAMECEALHPPLPIDDIQAHLLIQNGEVVKPSLVTLQVAGLKGKMDVEWGEKKQLLTFKLDGMAQDLADLFPEELHEAITTHFHQNRLMVQANLRKNAGRMELGGTVHIQRGSGAEQMDLIHFGCELKSGGEGGGVKYFPAGWFHAQKLPLEKYLSPFLFRNKAVDLSGEGEFKGSFDDRILSIKYDADHLIMENQKLRITVPSLHSSIPGQLIGSHQLDFQTCLYEGTLPIYSASYFEKNTGLLFDDIQGTVHFNNGTVRIDPIEAHCEGIYFGGELELDYRDPAPGVFDVALRCPSLAGKISNIQHFLAHIHPSSLLYHIPLDGDIAGKGKGLQLKFSFLPNDYHLQAKVKGVLNEGVVSFEGADMSLKGLFMDIDYDHQRQLLEFTDIQGALLVGKPRHMEEYLVTGHHIHVYSMTQPNVDVDIAIKDNEQELLRVVGHTQDKGKGMKGLYLNPKLSHISCIHPQEWKCLLSDGGKIEQLEFRSSFDLSSLLQDLRRFRQTGLFFLSHSLLNKMGHMESVEGKGNFSLRYHPDRNLLFELEGTQMKQGDSAEHYGLIKGSKQDKKWIFDQLQWDDWNAYAEVQQLDQRWRIPSLGLNIGQAVLLGLDGDFFSDEACLKAMLKYCQIDLSKLDSFPALQGFVAKWWPKGTLHATGEIEWNIQAPSRIDGWSAQLVASVDNLTVRNCPFRFLHPFKIDVKPLHSVKLNEVELELNHEAYFDLRKFEYSVAKGQVDVLETTFRIPSKQLESSAETLHHHFPELLDASLKEIVSNSKLNGDLEGTVAIETGSPDGSFFKLNLKDDLYRYKKREYDLKFFQLNIAGEQMQFSAQSKIENLHFLLSGQATWPSCEAGECQLTSLDGSKPLQVRWEGKSDGHLSIASIKGEFSGCRFALKKGSSVDSNSEWSPLEGSVAIDFNKLRAMLPLSLSDSIQKLSIDSLYNLEGSFWLSSDKGAAFYETLSFKGSLTSEEAVLKGVKMRKLRSDVQYVPGRLDLLNLSIEDPAGSVKAANGVVALDDSKEHWTFFIPLLTVKNLKPNLLRSVDSSALPNPKLRALVLKKVDFQDLKGDMDDVSTWQAQGIVQFLNASRKNPLQALFAIPGEIILRLGLDPHVLNPVTGIIYFNLQGDRFYLKRFKDMFSEGRGSKFYLVGPEPSWIDFEGNLSMNVRMKHYNLIFKITELFTVSIEGNIKKPRYSLQKQPRTSKKRGKSTPMKKGYSSLVKGAV